MQGVGCRVQGVGCRVQGVGCRVKGVVLGVKEPEQRRGVGRGPFGLAPDHLRPSGSEPQKSHLNDFEKSFSPKVILKITFKSRHRSVFTNDCRTSHFIKVPVRII